MVGTRGEAGWGSAQGTVYGDTGSAPGPFEGVGGGWKCSLGIKALSHLRRSESHGNKQDSLRTLSSMIAENTDHFLRNTDRCRVKGTSVVTIEANVGNRKW